MTFKKSALVASMFVIFFFLMYYESTEIFQLKIAVIWKGPLVLTLFAYVLLRGTVSPVPKMSQWGMIFGIASVINLSLFVDPISNISEGMKNLYIPLIFAAFHPSLNKHVSRESIYSVVLNISIFIIVSGIPFLIGVIEPIVESGYDLTLYNLDGAGFIGVFQTSHSASIALGFASIVIFHSISHKASKLKNVFLSALFVLGLASAYLTYARTGYLIIVIGIIIYLYYGDVQHKTLKIVFFCLALIIFAIYMLSVSEAFRMRLTGTNIYLEESGLGSGNYGSGRIEFFEAVFEYFFSSEFIYQLIGLGSSVSIDLMANYTGLRVYAHNGFLNILQFNGYLGSILFSVYLFYLTRVTILSKGTEHAALIISLYVAYIAQMFVQGERVFIADLVFALVLLLSQDKFSTLRYTGRSSPTKTSLAQ